jgi:hypothetical protein
MALSKKGSNKPAGKQAVKGGSSSGMHKFAGAAQQKPGGSAVTEVKGKGDQYAKGGSSGGMHGFSPVKPQKAGRSGQA